MTREDFIKANPIERVFMDHGVELKGGGNQRMAKCPFHQDSTASLSIKVSEGLWICHAGCGGGSVIDLIAKFRGTSPISVLKDSAISAPAISGKKHELQTEPKFETVATYDYSDGNGELVFQVLRQHAPAPEKKSGYLKTFRQRRPDDHGGWVYNMEGIERVLYRLPEVLKSKTVWICEGEKDADTLQAAGFVATCNVGGAGKWMEGYNESLSKRNVAICGDNDEPGKKHAKQVFDSLSGKAKTVRLIKIPDPFKDVTDYSASFSNADDFKKAMHSLFDDAVPFIKGAALPIMRLSEAEDRYRRQVTEMAKNSFAFGRWLPSLSRIRPLVPGEFALVLGGTGIGKTAFLSNIAMSAKPLPTLFFEMELPLELMFERGVALASNTDCADVEREYRNGEYLGEKYLDLHAPHLYICAESRMTVPQMEAIIVKSELKIGERPRLVLVDYVGLIRSEGHSRYEQVSRVAEDLKVIAKSTQTIVIAASQVGRMAPNEKGELRLDAGKDSGSLENSSGLVLGVWRDDKDAGTMHVKVLKSTKGGAGIKVVCNYHVGTLKITERSELWPT